MAVTEVLQIPDLFDVDDDVSDRMANELGREDPLPELTVLAEAGMLGLHLGVLRRFAMLGLGAPARSNRPDANR